MGYLCNTADQVALRHYRQKRFARIQPLFTNKYTNVYNPNLYWYSYDDDFNNGNSQYSPLFGEQVTASNFSIVLPDSEVFHIQASIRYSVENANYLFDSPSIDVIGETTLTKGSTLRYSADLSYKYTRDKPWEKYGLSWYCSSTLKTQKSTWTGAFGQDGVTPIYTDWSTIATDNQTYFNDISQSSTSQASASNSLYVPAGTQTMGEGPNSGIVVERTRFLGSLSVYGHTIYRKGAYHHA